MVRTATAVKAAALALVLGASLVGGAPTAEAHGWRHGGPRVVFSVGAPVYRPYYAPPPVYYAPPPVYYAPPPPVYYAPPPAYYAPPPGYYRPY